MRVLAPRLLRSSAAIFRYRTVNPTRYFTANASAAISKTSDDSSQPAPKERHVFQAETKKLLDIVANSLYSDKEVFCRELISNAADALEKRRHLASTNASAMDDKPLTINIQLDKDAKTFTIQDNGIGMNKEEMIDFLGTIARSGSKKFMEDLNDPSTKTKIIGQFGVGFYSALMVGDKIEVFSKSAKDPDAPGHLWTSDGLGEYEIETRNDVEVGTKIIIHLKEDALNFCDQRNVETVVKKYSNFVGFPIHLNNERLNTVDPIWTMEKTSVTDDQHKQFYRFIANAWDDYQYKLHFQTDAPININSLLYVPERHNEQLGMGRMEPGVSLYSRKVLIQSKAKKLLPEYLRFVKGVIDSEDIPMNISREMLQNSMLLNKLRDVMTMKVIKWLQDEDRRDRAKFENFFRGFGSFIKEGICLAENKHQKELAKLLRFDSSHLAADKKESQVLATLDDYLERKKAEQKDIYYLIASSRAWAEESPYYEPFKKNNIEVLFLYDHLDEFVVEHLKEYKGVALKSIDQSGDLDILKSKNEESTTTPEVSKDDETHLAKFFRDTLGSSVSDVKIAARAHSYPAVIVDHESPALRRLLQMVPKEHGIPQNPSQKLEVNASHPLIHSLLATAKLEKDATKSEMARDIVHQVYDNALIAAGLMDDPKRMLKRLNTILERSLSSKPNEAA